MLASSIALSVRSRAVLGNASPSTACEYDVSASVIAWPGESCHIEPIDSKPGPIESEEGISCPAIQKNAKCFRIWQGDDESSEPNHEPRDTTPYKARPIRQAPEQQTLAVGARSISLRWPDRMQHAVFFSDEECHGAGAGRPEFTWHVERLEAQVAQCESPPAGLFRSVEFMKQGDYDAFSRKMRGQDGQVTKAPWKGI
ncbi:MAG: hypothetical protein L6R41_006927 [Letrouitia leprolyta]|nr:MAG: hypothetical protein L6R41_006927 [Letrouitia leprolyta]